MSLHTASMQLSALAHQHKSGAGTLLPSPHKLGRVSFNKPVVVQKTQRKQRCTAVTSVLEEAALPADYVRYETMIILRPDMSDEIRDVQLAKFQSFLDQQNCKEINSVIRGRQPLAYPMKGKWEGVYVLYTYAAHPSTSTAVQKMLSTPEAGGESNILRHMTFRV